MTDIDPIAEAKSLAQLHQIAGILHLIAGIMGTIGGLLACCGTYGICFCMPLFSIPQLVVGIFTLQSASRVKDGDITSNVGRLSQFGLGAAVLGSLMLSPIAIGALVLEILVMQKLNEPAIRQIIAQNDALVEF